MTSSPAASSSSRRLVLPGPPGAPALSRLPCGAVTPLVVANDLGRVLQLARPPPRQQPGQADPVQTPAHLLRRHLRVFPPAAERPARTRTSTSGSTRSGAAAAPRNCAPR